MLPLPTDLRPGAVLSWQAQAEAQYTGALEAATRAALTNIRDRALAGPRKGMELTPSFASAQWVTAVDRALDAVVLEPDLRADLQTELVATAIGTEAHSTVLAVLNTWRFDEPMSLRQEGVTVGETVVLRNLSMEEQLSAALGLTELPLLAAGASPTEWLTKQGRYWRTRLKREARTSFTGVTGRIVLRELQRRARTRPVRKRWVCRHDDRVRSSHLEADGQVRELAEPFRVGDALLQYPGEKTGPLGEVASCRCVVGEA